MTNSDVVNHAVHESADGIEIPPYPRKPENGTREATDWMIGRIDYKVK